MVMKVVGKIVTKMPTATILAVLILTSLLGYAYFGIGAEMEAEEETFLPDNELVNAEIEIKDIYGTTRPVQVLVKSKNGDVLTSDALTEMLRLEKGFLEDENINSTLISERNPQRMISPADTIIIGKILLDLIAEMDVTFQDMNASFTGIGQMVNGSHAAINQAIGTPYLNTTLLSLNESLSENISIMQSLFAGLQCDTGTSDMFAGLQYLTMDAKIEILTMDAKIEIMENMNDSDVKENLSNLIYYNGTPTQNLNYSVYQFDTTLTYILGQLMQFNCTLQVLEKITDNISVYMAIKNMEYIASQLTTTVFGTSYMIEAMDIDNTTKMLDSAVGLVGYMLPMMLTKDFNMAGSELKAKGCMIMVQFNATELPGESSDAYRDRFLELEKKMVKVVDAQDPQSTEMRVMGIGLMSEEIINAANESMNILLPLAVILVIVVLAIIYRSVLDILFSVLALGFAIIWAWGFGVVLGFTFNPMTIAVPVMIVGLGIDYGIHIIMRYREEIREGYDPSSSVRTTTSTVGTALLLATFTTIVAFLSNLISDMTVLREFGVLLAIGIMASFIIMLTFVPACRQLVDLWKMKKGKPLLKNAKPSKRPKWHKVKGSGISALNKALGGGAVAVEHHPYIVISVVVLITGMSIVGALNLRTEFDLKDFLPEELEVTQNINYLMNEFNVSGTETAYILVKGDLTNPEVLKAMDNTINNMADDRYVLKNAYGKPDVTSILSVMRDVADDQTLSNPLDVYSAEFKMMYEGNDTNNDGIPNNNISALYDWLYTNENTTDMVSSVLHRTDDGKYDGSVIRIKVDTQGNTKSGELYDELKADSKPLKTLVNNGVINQATVTGMPILMYVIMNTLTDSMFSSMLLTILFSLLALTVVFWFVRKSLVLGLITLIPVLLVVSWILGTMFLLGISFNVLTISVTALTVGLGITYGIHITHRFLEDIDRFDNIDEACGYTVRHTGTALFGAAATTIAGFGILTFSLLPPMQQFGGIVALTILYSFLASVFVLPTFLVLWAKWRKKQKKVY